MYAVSVACSASSAEMAVTFASSYSHPHLPPPVVPALVAVVPFPPAEPPPPAAAAGGEPGAVGAEAVADPATALLPAGPDDDVSLLSRHNAV